MKKLFFGILVVAVLLVPTSAIASEGITIHSWSPTTPPTITITK